MPRPRRLTTQLTPAENKILRLVSQAKTNIEMAGELFVSKYTIRTHLRNIYEKLGVRNQDHHKNYSSRFKLIVFANKHFSK